jgi:histidyl-tRNA synthetase
LEAAEQFDLVPDPQTKTVVLITVFNKKLFEDSLKYAVLQRESGVSAEIYPSDDTKLEKQLKYADKKGIPWVVIMGPEEKEKGTIKLKNMKAGTEEEMPYHDLAAKLR